MMSVCPSVLQHETKAGKSRHVKSSVDKSALGETWKIQEAVKTPVDNAKSRLRDFEVVFIFIWSLIKIITKQFFMEETNCQSSALPKNTVTSSDEPSRGRSPTLPQESAPVSSQPCPTMESRPQTIEQASQVQALSPVSGPEQQTLQMVPVLSKRLFLPSKNDQEGMSLFELRGNLCASHNSSICAEKTDSQSSSPDFPEGTRTGSTWYSCPTLKVPILPLLFLKSFGDLNSSTNCQFTLSKSTSGSPNSKHISRDQLSLKSYPKQQSLQQDSLTPVQIYPYLTNAVLSKLDSSSFYSFRQGNTQVNNELSKWRKRYPIRQPVARLELEGKNDVYLTSSKTRRTVRFGLSNDNKFELLRIEPEYIDVDTPVFGTKTSRLMKKDPSPESTDEWKDLCRFVMKQFGLHMNREGNVLDNSKVPDYVETLKFGAKLFPTKLFDHCLKKWNQETTALAELSVSFKEQLEDKQKVAEELLSGLKFKKVWSPSSHDESSFCDAELLEYEDWLDSKYSLTLHDDPVLLYAALSDDKEKLAVLAIADHAVKLSFCYLKDEGAFFELRDRFMEITKSYDYDCVCEPKFDAMLQWLRSPAKTPCTHV